MDSTNGGMMAAIQDWFLSDPLRGLAPWPA
jgi:hypothetical protein